MKKTIFLKTTIIILSLLVTSASYAQKKEKKVDKSKYLEGKKYKVQFYEMKPTGRGKALESTVTFKDGKVESELMNDKLKINGAAYKIILDSTYTEDETESRLLKIEGQYSNDRDEAKWEATVNNFDIEGTVVERKNGVDKKKFEFSGSEKTKK